MKKQKFEAVCLRRAAEWKRQGSNLILCFESVVISGATQVYGDHAYFCTFHNDHPDKVTIFMLIIMGQQFGKHA